MLNKQQKQAKENLQEKLYNFMKKCRDILSLPEYKNLADITLGVLKSKSVVINQIAPELSEEISRKKTCERLYRNLQKDDLAEKVQQVMLENQSSQIDSETAIIVDDSDIVKAKARKMEGLKRVRDGSTGTYDRQGYDLINLIACKRQAEGYRIIPVSSDLVSRKIETDSLIQLTHDRIVEVIIRSRNKGVFVFDRGYDSRAMFEFFSEHGCSYIVRSTAARGLIVEGREESFIKVAKSVQRTMKV